MAGQVTSLRLQGVMTCILSGHPGVSNELLLTASNVRALIGVRKPNNMEILWTIVHVCEQ